ncbi:YgfZ/GcvT domain-containing protein [Cerasicoccus arenae]|uniref:Folate-binding protein YgfZ n=1 Tax=Cerasicoccus arenae TaxID=424488 RepID=A0A8J3DKZ1_9BACT|nr:hypothetical protein [Cerasicoccus arenae]MBK1859988.1 hypothetical protein [Cerasicoccus arenae]GHC12421.1 folate-binding protein YgfZ [Cerasicoccus arenae]
MGNLYAYQSTPCVLSVTGEDAFSYLQSQFSNDLRRTDARPVTYGLFLDRKGKVQADSFALQLNPERFLLVSYHAEPAALINKVEANIIADEVELEDVSAQYRLVTLWGNETQLSGLLADVGTYIEQTGTLIYRGRQMTQPHIDCLIPADAIFSLPNAAQASVTELLAARIDSGIPAIPQDIGLNDLPHEGGDLSKSAVSYTKGCYLGQEVMARLHAMGRPQRALYQVSFSAQNPPERIPVYSEEKAVGEITSNSAGKGLALIKRRYVSEKSKLFGEQPGGFPVHVIGEITT